MDLKPRKICVFSGKRGGFGAYVPLMRLIESDPNLELQILLGDMHTAETFGRTVAEAKKFFPGARIELIEMGSGRGDTPEIRVENLGQCLTKSASVLKNLAPDIVMVHGDRAEHLMIALSALNLGLAVTHSQGGDVSGNIDDILRHAITKLAHVHFPENEAAAQRIIKLGEDPARVFAVGSLYLDRIVKKMYTPISEAKEKYGLAPAENYFVVLLHPDTFETPENNYLTMHSILAALKKIGQKAIIVYPCSDPGYEKILKAIKEKENNPQFLIYKNIDNLDFLGLLAGSQALIGNSSASLVEAPYLQLPAIILGKRQLGREKEANVVEAEVNSEAIIAKINFVSTNQEFRDQLARCGHHLGQGGASEKIIKILKELKINQALLRKRLTY